MTKHYQGSSLNIKPRQCEEIKNFFPFCGGKVGVDKFTKLLFSTTVLSLAWMIPPPHPTPILQQPPNTPGCICPFYESSFFFFPLLSFLSFFPNTEIETVSGLIYCLPAHQLPRCLDKFYALCSANIKTVLGSASRSLIKNSLIKSSCKM